MILSLIAAAAENNAIGLKNKIPWQMPRDMKHFSEITKGHTVIMGRNTFESIGKALPGRTNIVVTHRKDWQAPDCAAVHSLDEALRQATQDEEVFVIGGAQLYAEALPKAGRVYLTRIHAEVAGDAFFPALNKNEWIVNQSKFEAGDEKNQFDATYEIYERKKV